MRLYHGSKSGIKGDIVPGSRAACDFGTGFYMGDLPDQPKGLIAAHENNMFYELECNFDGLKIKEFGDSYDEQIDWALYIAYNRGNLDKKYELLHKRYAGYNNGYDLIVGLIADDKMTQALQRFFNGELCDRALIEALQKVKLGKQYVAKTEEACSDKHIKIVYARPLTVNEKKSALVTSKNRNNTLENMFDQFKVRYRRANNVKYFDEIIEEWNRY